jgi:hypothetical protein
VKLAAPGKGKASEKTRRSAKRDLEAGEKPQAKVSAKRSRATTAALKREPKSTVSKGELSRHAKAAAKERGPSDRSAAARKASRTKGASERSQAAKKAARTRARQKSGD